MWSVACFPPTFLAIVLSPLLLYPADAGQYVYKTEYFTVPVSKPLVKIIYLLCMALILCRSLITRFCSFILFNCNPMMTAVKIIMLKAKKNPLLSINNIIYIVIVYIIILIYIFLLFIQVLNIFLN